MDIGGLAHDPTGHPKNAPQHAKSRRLRGSVPDVPLGRRAPELDWLAWRSRSQHRARGGRPARRGTTARPRRPPLDRAGPARCATSRTAELRSVTNRFANVLAELGVGAGDRVFVLAGRIPELYVAALGTLKNRAVFCPLFSAFGPEPIRARLAIGEARVLVTTESLYRSARSRRCAPCSRRSSTCCWSVMSGGATAIARHARPAAPDGRSERRVRDRARPTPRTSPCCTSPAAPPARPRAPCTSTRRSSRTTSPASSRSTCTPTTSSGAPPTRAG